MKSLKKMDDLKKTLQDNLIDQTMQKSVKGGGNNHSYVNTNGQMFWIATR